MSADPFFDSNVLLYLVSDDGAKADRAEALLAEGGMTSVQVLNEMSNVAIRKHGMSWSQVGTLLEPVRALCRIEPLSEATHDLGAHLAMRYQSSVYDAMIVAAALLAGADTLYSEDMHDGLLIEGRLRIRNPFRVRSVQDAP
jgi:predicted nucleic acid-binding protein